MVHDSKFFFIGNRQFLDFVNTQVFLDRQELWENFSDLLEWFVQAEVLDTGAVREVKKRWKDTSKGERALEMAREFRAELRGMTDELVSGHPVSQKTLRAINRVLKEQNEYSQLLNHGGGYATQVRLRIEEPVHLLVPIAKSAAEFLSREDCSSLHKCESPECILYFFDTSKNQKRRWCSMALCGNRTKAAAHYRRKRKLN